MRTMKLRLAEALDEDGYIANEEVTETETEGLTGHLGTESPNKSRNGRGFKWNSETGKYTQL